MTGIALLAAAPAVAVAQAAEKEKQGEMQEGMHAVMSAGQSESMMDCQQMMEKMKEMRAKQQEMQAELDELVTRMNEASGENQQMVMAELLTTLIEQRSKMHSMMQKMQPMMMQHMMGHMKSREGGGMSCCPMMQKMHPESSSETTSAGQGDHSKHH
jgi:predicted transcriptional regulator